MNRLSIASALLLSIAPIAAAATDKPARPPGATLLHLSEHADRVLPQDEIVALLRIEATGKTPLEVETEVNRRTAAALDEARKSPAIQFDIPAMNVRANRDSKFSSGSGSSAGSWTATQSIQLRSKEFTPALALVGKLEEQQLAVASLTFTFSRETLAAVQDPLTAEALHRLSTRAEAVAADLGMAVDHVEDLVVGDAAATGSRPSILVAGSYATEATPAVEAGRAPVTVIVTAEVVLRPKH
jgi:predicted secreted protein